MSRFRRALVAMIMAVAATGGGLLSAAAVAAPAAAAAPASPPGSQTFTITGHLTKQATSGISPNAISPCAAVKGASTCLPQEIICWITVPAPVISQPDLNIDATAAVHCDHPVASIRLDEELYENGVLVDHMPVSGEGVANAVAFVGAFDCGPIRYDNFGFASVDFPADYSPGTGYLHHLESFTETTAACTPPPPPGGGGGGGGGCATTSASSSAHPAARHPDLVTCQ